MADVLIVEDSTLQANLIREFLRKRHTVVGWAKTADEAVELMQESDPDAVVMDLNLEDGNGIDATATIKSHQTGIPVIVSTVNVTTDVKDQAIDAGADAYLTKPYSRQALLETLDHLCSEFCYPDYDYYDRGE